MAPAKLWLRIFLAGFAVIVALLLVTLLTPVPYGDLSRLGRMSDTEFGWRKPPPRVAPEQLQASPVAQADILVIGDSFSMTYRWQSVLQKAGYRVSTVFWGQFNEALCADFDKWLADGGFRGKLVIIESVERLLNQRMQATDTCQTMKKPLVQTKQEPFLQPLEELPGFALNTAGTLTSGWITYQNTKRAKNSPGDTFSDYQTRSRVVADGCQQFSNQLCTKSLFFAEDDDNGELTPANVASMQAFTKAHPAIPILWMVVPNKTTVYIENNHSKDFVSAFRASGLGPDLFEFAQSQRRKVMDFYFPNDTHLSMHGQLVLGDFMLAEVRKILPTPPTRSP